MVIRFSRSLPSLDQTAVSGNHSEKYAVGCCLTAIPEAIRELSVLPTDPASIKNIPLVFSALPADIAKDVEPAFARAGVTVCSNASAYRRESDVPILLPEVNPDHLAVVASQRKRNGWSGCIVTNPNCTSTGLTIALKALQDAFGLSKLFVVSMQALSGAGYPGVPSLDILDNVIPNIGGEEEKVEWETRKMLGKVSGNEIALADFTVSAHTNRVAVSDGHMVCVSVQFDKKASAEEAIEVLRSYQAPESSRSLPSAPDPVIIYRSEIRPSPTPLDRMEGRGMATVVGRVRPDPLFDIKFVVLSHNTIRGAAGGSIYNAELMLKQGMIG